MSASPPDLPGGLPDESTLSRLANEMFAAVPGGGVAPAVAPSDAASAPRPSWFGAPLPGVGVVSRTSPLPVPLPGEAEIRAMLAPRVPSPMAITTPEAGLPGETATPPSAPQGVVPPPQTLTDYGAVTAAEPAASQRPSWLGAPVPGAVIPRTSPSPVPIPGEAEIRSLLSGHVGSPMTPEPVTAVQAASPFYFLTESRETQPPAAGYGSSWETAHPAFDALAARRDFPILQETVNGKPLIWLDNAATTQKPQAVIDRLSYFYQHENSNIHRGAHELAARATDAYEAARDKAARFLNASSSEEIVFVRGTTEAINLVAQSWGRQNLVPGDEIVITWLEHHANIVPWQQLCTQTGAVLRVVPVDNHGQVRLDAYEALLGPRTRLVSFTQVSNALGTVTPAKLMAEMAHRYGARVLVDGAQAVSHMRVDVQSLDADWYVFSGHKVFGPTGIGVLYGKRDLLESMPPWQGGGNMIKDVTFEKTEYHSAPMRFEAGTGNIADAVGLGAAIDYLEKVGVENVTRHEHQLIVYATKLLSDVPGLRIIGTAAEKAGVISFVLDGSRSEDVGSALNRDGVAVRSGHHCAQPILRRFGLESTVRPSFALYNTFADVDVLVGSLRRIQSGINPLRG
jgi:cysteine desulfurase/selenocysteine lyase